ncbi:hypothetical protein B0H10DRAFT_2045007 [Mycena sp. CBHHK59/15]|nr:hypothetical protein B0H10DRAFT_2045007 [Mycena sp. CBHHK59/15]
MRVRCDTRQISLSMWWCAICLPAPLSARKEGDGSSECDPSELLSKASSLGLFASKVRLLRPESTKFDVWWCMKVGKEMTVSMMSSADLLAISLCIDLHIS